MKALVSSVLASVGLFFFSAPAWAQTPPSAEIRQVQIVGAACENASVTLSPDLQDLSVLFDNYSVEIGQGSSTSVLRLQKDCQIKVTIAIPPNWSFAFKAVDYRGFAALPASSWGFHRFTYMNNLQQISSMREAVLKGPINQEYNVRVQQKPERLVWTPCGRSEHTITLLSQLGVSYYPRSNDRSLSQIVLDSTDASIKQSLSFAWRACSR